MSPQRNIKDRLFSFAIITDTHLNQSDTQCNSPFAVNRLSNRRLRFVIDDLNQRDIEAVFHLGDVVHPVPSMGQLYAHSAAQFFGQIKHLQHPIYMIPGNHDVGDKAVGWGPAGTVRDEFLAAWSSHFGNHYFHRQIGPVHCLGINAQIIGSGLAMEAQQQRWLEEELCKLKGERLLLLTHYPPFLLHSDEAEHYDNLGHAGRQWMLELLRGFRFEALFAGHVHNFWYHRYGDCDCYLLPSTAFVRQDYSEMFRVSPGAQFGRNDAAKLGYGLIHVYPDGHDFEMVRCLGIERAQDDIGRSTVYGGLPPVNPRTNSHPLLGFDLRHDWAEEVAIPPSGGLDEFERKQVRNDYPLLALWEMGGRLLRIPLSDLLAPKHRARMHDLYHLGFRFVIYSWGTPAGHRAAKVLEHIALVHSWEIGWHVTELSALDNTFLAALKAHGVPVLLSPFRAKHDVLEAGETYYHTINHGLLAKDLRSGPISQFTDVWGGGWVARLDFQDDLPSSCAALQGLAEVSGCAINTHLRLSGKSPSEGMADDGRVCNHLAKAMFCAAAYPALNLICDTLADHDRGYFPRVGVVDRLFNPKDGFYVVKHLHAWFEDQAFDSMGVTGPLKTDITGTIEHLRATLNGQIITLLLPGADTPASTWCDVVAAGAQGGCVKGVDLIAGTIFGPGAWSSTVVDGLPRPLLLMSG